MNGQVAEVKGNGKKQIEPGCEIVVPNKTKKFNFATIISNATSCFVGHNVGFIGHNDEITIKSNIL